MTARRSSKRRGASESWVSKRRRPSGRDFLDHALAVMVITFISLAGENRIEEGHPGAINAGAFWWIFVPLLLIWIFLPDRKQVLGAVKWTAALVWRFIFKGLLRKGRTRQKASGSLGDMLALGDRGFEEKVAAILEGLGFRDVERVGGSGDVGRDVVCYDERGDRVVVQCKCFVPSKSVGSPHIQAFMGGLVHHRAKYGIFATTSGYTGDAIELASEHQIIALDGLGILQLQELTGWDKGDDSLRELVSEYGVR